jgi:aminoglycoside 6'-N-acetyltransferase
LLPRHGNGVALRRLQPGDLAAFQAYRADPDLGRYQGWSAMTDAEALAFLASVEAAPLFQPGEWMQIGIAEPGSLALLGDIGLFLSADATEAEIGFTLARPAQGRGLASAAVRAALQLVFEATAVRRVLGTTDARNHASIRLLERVGMRRIEVREVEFRGERCVEWIHALERDAKSDALEFSDHDDPPSDAVSAVDAGLDLHNQAAAPLGDVRPLAALARAPGGRVVGGAVGRTWGQCCELLQLWVDPAYRARGVASRLLHQFETRAALRGCSVYYLTTLSFQAPAFYRKRGYTAHAEISGYPEDIVKYLMVKGLPRATSPAPGSQ